MQQNLNDDYSTHYVEKKVLNNKDKKQIKKNIIKLIIGLFLLVISWSYLQKHPAEKVSMFSVFEVLQQKISIFVQNSFGNHGELLERKYGMEKYYKELLKMAEDNACINEDIVNEIKQTLEKLKREKNKNLEPNLPEYTKKAYEYDNIVKNNDC